MEQYIWLNTTANDGPIGKPLRSGVQKMNNGLSKIMWMLNCALSAKFINWNSTSQMLELTRIQAIIPIIFRLCVEYNIFGPHLKLQAIRNPLLVSVSLPQLLSDQYIKNTVFSEKWVSWRRLPKICNKKRW